jgi:hypothetical protein
MKRMGEGGLNGVALGRGDEKRRRESVGEEGKVKREKNRR